MPAPAKPKKTIRNQPGAFDEMIVTLPASPRMARTPRTRADQIAPQSKTTSSFLSDANMKRAIMVMWFGAVIIGGIGLGRLILENRQPISFEAPVPVATAAVGVSTIPTTNILFAQVTSVDQLKVAPASSSDQAQAGISFKTMSVAGLQGANVSDALQPGFNHFDHSQGNLGTAPVR